MIGGTSSLQNELYALLKELEDKNESHPFNTSSPSNFSTSVSAKSEDVTHSSVTTDTVMNDSLPSVDADDAIEAVIKSQSTSNDNQHLDEITQDLHGGANIVEMVENIFTGGNRGGNKGSNKGSKPQSRKHVKRNHKHNHDASTATSNDEPHSKDYSGQEIIDQIFNGNKNTTNDVCEACGETENNTVNSHHTRGGNANILDSSDSESSEKKDQMNELGMNADMFNVTYSNKNGASSDAVSDGASDDSSDSSTDSDDVENIKRIRREMNHQMKAYEGDEEGNTYASPSKLDLGFNPSSDSDNDDDGDDDNDDDSGKHVDSDGGSAPNSDAPNSDSPNTPNSDSPNAPNGQLNSNSDSNSDADAINDFIPLDKNNIGLHPDVIDSKLNESLPNDLDLEDSDNEFDGSIGLDPSFPDDYIVKEHNSTSSDFNDHSDFIKIIHEMRANDNNIVLNGGNVKVAKRIKMMNMYPWILKSSSRY